SVWQVDGKRIVGHGGGFPGFITRIALNLDDDIGVIVLANANDSPSGFIADGIFETIFRFATGDYFSGPARAGLSRLEGTYRSRWGDQVVVSTGSKLVGFAPQTNSPLKEGTVLRPAAAASFVMDSPFSYDSPGERARFVGRTGDGRATRLIWGSQPMDRIP